MTVFRVIFRNGMVMDFPSHCWLVSVGGGSPSYEDVWEVRKPIPPSQGPSLDEAGEWVCTVRDWVFYGDVDKEVDVESVRDNLKEIQDGLS